MSTNIKSVLSAFNAASSKAVSHEAGTAIVEFTETKSAYGRAVRDIAIVALSGRWRTAAGTIMSDNGIEDAFGVPVRHPRARLSALITSGLEFKTDADIKDNAAVWAHVSKMYNAGKDGRDLLKKTAETVKAISDVADKRTAWLETAIPKRVTQSRAAQPPEPKSDPEPVVNEVTDDENGAELIVPENAPLVNVKALNSAELLALFSDIGSEMVERFAALQSGERMALVEAVSVLSQSVDYAVKQTAKK